MSALLMLERVLLGGEPETGGAEVDRAIIDRARSTVREILEDAELRLWELEDRGWLAPEDDSAVGYAARLLLVSDRLDELVRAIRLAQELTFAVSTADGAVTAREKPAETAVEPRSRRGEGDD